MAYRVVRKNPIEEASMEKLEPQLELKIKQRYLLIFS